MIISFIPALKQALILWVLACFVLAIALVLLRFVLGIKLPKLWYICAPFVMLYICSVIGVTMLPLPSADEYAKVCASSNTLYYPRYFLGWSFELSRRNTAGQGLLAALTTNYMKELILNIVLFIPWGIFMAWLFRARFRGTLLSGFGASLLIELTQLTGIWGYYPCRYRTFDVEDIFTNTLGALIGWILMSLLLRWNPLRK